MCKLSEINLLLYRLSVSKIATPHTLDRLKDNLVQELKSRHKKSGTLSIVSEHRIETGHNFNWQNTKILKESKRFEH